MEAQATNAASVALTGSEAIGRKSAFENGLLNVLTLQFLSVTSFLLERQAAVRFEKANKRLCLHL